MLASHDTNCSHMPASLSCEQTLWDMYELESRYDQLDAKVSYINEVIKYACTHVAAAWALCCCHHCPSLPHLMPLPCPALPCLPLPQVLLGSAEGEQVSASRAHDCLPDHGRAGSLPHGWPRLCRRQGAAAVPWSAVTLNGVVFNEHSPNILFYSILAAAVCSHVGQARCEAHRWKARTVLRAGPRAHSTYIRLR